MEKEKIDVLKGLTKSEVLQALEIWAEEQARERLLEKRGGADG